jgi:hypothetical protein
MKCSTVIALCAASFVAAVPGGGNYGGNSYGMGSPPGGIQVANSGSNTVVDVIVVIWSSGGGNMGTTTVNQPPMATTGATHTVSLTITIPPPPKCSTYREDNNLTNVYRSSLVVQPVLYTHQTQFKRTSAIWSSSSLCRRIILSHNRHSLYLARRWKVVSKKVHTSSIYSINNIAGMDSGFMGNPNNTINPPPQVAMQVTSQGPLCK